MVGIFFIVAAKVSDCVKILKINSPAHDFRARLVLVGCEVLL